MSGTPYPILSMGYKADSYQETLEDPSDQSKMEGGYVVSRLKFTRAPRTTYSFSYTELPDADKKLLQAFYKQMGGGASIISFTDPFGVAHDVRFVKALDFKFMGVGTSYYNTWSVDVSLQEV